MSNANPYRVVPSIDVLKDALRSHHLSLADSVATTISNQVLASVRAEIGSGERPTREHIIERVVEEARYLLAPRLAPLINATGVIVHTNLGRSPVSAATAEAMIAAASNYVPLEIDRASGQRGGRMDEVSRLMRVLTGAEATLLVTNNAAAVLLTLSALASGRSVIVSRGEAVEIGGGFRVPDVLRQSGARLVDVGTTNRTYPRDYEHAIDASTALFLKVHPSNFFIAGFTATTTTAELATVARSHGLPIVEDLGSGALMDTRQFGLHAEPTIGESIAAGASVVTASGDKLLGGPQAGIIAGERQYVTQIARHPLARAVRADKTILAGVAATLRHYVVGDVVDAIPVWRMIAASPHTLERRAERIVTRLAGNGISVEMARSDATIGGGSLPGQTLPSVALKHRPAESVDAMARCLRLGEPAVVARIADDHLWFDLRSVLPEQDDRLSDAILQALTPRA